MAFQIPLWICHFPAISVIYVLPRPTGGYSLLTAELYDSSGFANGIPLGIDGPVAEFFS